MKGLVATRVCIDHGSHGLGVQGLGCAMVCGS